MNKLDYLLICLSLLCAVYYDSTVDGAELPVYHNNYLTTEVDEQYGSSLAKCEYYAMRVGSELADVINAPHFDKDTSQRIYQDYVVENLGFAKWIGDGMGGRTLTGKDSHELHKKNGWIGKGLDEGPYKILSNKWIYFFGDSTTRQVWASFAAPFKDNSFERNVKEWTRHYCGKQDKRKKRHPKDPGIFDEEGWRGPCGANEVTCHVSGYGTTGLLTYDWKHFPYDDYDEYLFGEKGAWQAGFPGEGERRPDLFVIQFGLHSCTHANTEGPHSKHLHDTNFTMMEQHLNQVETLIASVRRSIDFHPEQERARNRSHIVFMTSGMSNQGAKGIMTDSCVQTMNSKITEIGHRYGFAVLERGEIERRLMFRSTFSDNPVFNYGDAHLLQPAQNIIATSLLHLYSCLQHYQVSQTEYLDVSGKYINETVPSYPLKATRAFRSWGQAQPLHNPQARI